jgi:hypothetical protein
MPLSLSDQQLTAVMAGNFEARNGVLWFGPDANLQSTKPM